MISICRLPLAFQSVFFPRPLRAKPDQTCRRQFAFDVRKPTCQDSWRPRSRTLDGTHYFLTDAGTPFNLRKRQLPLPIEPVSGWRGGEGDPRGTGPHAAALGGANTGRNGSPAGCLWARKICERFRNSCAAAGHPDGLGSRRAKNPLPPRVGCRDLRVPGWVLPEQGPGYKRIPPRIRIHLRRPCRADSRPPKTFAVQPAVACSKSYRRTT